MILFPGEYPKLFVKLVRKLTRSEFQINPSPFLLNFHSLEGLNIRNQGLDDLERISRYLRERFKDPKFAFLLSDEMDPDEIFRALVQRLILYLRPQVLFVRQCQEVYASENIQVVFLVNKELRGVLKQLGFPVHDSYSAVLYGFQTFFNFISAIKIHFQEQLKALKNFFVLQFRRRIPNRVDVIWLDLSEEYFSEEVDELNIREFLKLKRFSFLEENPTIFLQRLTSDKQMTPKLFCGRDPFMHSGRKRVPLADLLQQMVLSWKSLGYLIRAFFKKQWWNFIFSNEVAQLPRIKQYLKQESPKYVLHSLLMTKEPLWTLLRKKFHFESWLVLYSTNFIPINFKGDSQLSSDPYLRNIISDKITVWGAEQKQWFLQNNYNPSRLLNTGPIIFGAYPHMKAPSPRHRVQIAVYDVVVIHPSYLITKYGFLSTYYNFENMSQFILDIKETATEVFGPSGFEILFKSKRSARSFEDGRYFEFIQSLKNQEWFISVKPQKNPFLVSAQADFTISAPFTSPSILARVVDRPNCFYDPTGQILSRFVTKDHPPILQSKVALKNWFQLSTKAELSEAQNHDKSLQP